jgi:hypothetical protein
MKRHRNTSGNGLARAARTPRMCFLRLRRSLWAAGILRIQFVYCALAEVPYVTLTAAPRRPGDTVKIPLRARRRLARTFTDWMAQSEPDWHSGPDCAGVLVWELTGNRFTHHHSGYTLRFFARSSETTSLRCKTPCGSNLIEENSHENSISHDGSRSLPAAPLLESHVL